MSTTLDIYIQDTLHDGFSEYIQGDTVGEATGNIALEYSAINYGDDDVPDFRDKIREGGLQFPIALDPETPLEDGCVISLVPMFTFYLAGNGKIKIHTYVDPSPAAFNASHTHKMSEHAEISETFVDWTRTSWTAETRYDSPELKSLIQDLLDHVDFDNGDRVGFVLIPDHVNWADGDTVRFYDYSEAEEAKRARLRLVYTSSASYTLTASTGSFSITGQSSGLTASRKIITDLASFSLSGIPCGSIASRVLSCSVCEYQIAGQPLGLYYNRKLISDTTTFACTNYDASVLVSRLLSAETGQLIITGISTQLLAHRIMSASFNAFVMTTVEAGLLASRIITASTTNFYLVGFDALLVIPNVTLTASTGVFVCSYSDASLVRQFNLIANAGIFSFVFNNIPIVMRPKHISLTTLAGRAKSVSLLALIARMKTRVISYTAKTINIEELRARAKQL